MEKSQTVLSGNTVVIWTMPVCILWQKQFCHLTSEIITREVNLWHCRLSGCKTALGAKYFLDWNRKTNISETKILIDYFTCKECRMIILVQLHYHFRADQKLNHVVKGILQMPLKPPHREGWDINHLSRKPVPVLNPCLVKKYFRMSTLNLLWCISEPFSCILSLLFQGEEISTSLFTCSPWEASESDVSSQSPLLWTRQAQSPQPLLTGHPFHQLWCTLLNAFKDLHVLLKLWRPELNGELKERLHQ